MTAPATTTPPARARLPSRPPRPTAAELEHHPARLWDWMELERDYACLEALTELREEEERAWDMAVTKCPPGHA
jgi:hypothetical protein